MTDSARLALNLGIQGLKDSVLGLTRVYQIDKDQRATTTHEDQQKDEPQTSLARRRAERIKHKSEPKKEKDPRILHRIMLCCAWNGGVFWMSIVAFNYILLPSLEFFTHFIFGGSTTHGIVWGWMGPLLSWTFGTLWILPLFVLSKIVNSLWFQDIADQAYKRSRGRPQTFPSLGKLLADILFSLLLQAFFLIQGMLASLLPLPAIGNIISTLHLCLLYSLYAFEYSWYNRGWEVHKRLAYIETGWPYFVGFGFPLAFLTNMPSSYIVSGCVFSILFPLFIISANEADTACATFPYPLKLFGLVIHMSNAVFRHSLTKSTRPSGQPSSAKGTPVKQVKMSEPRKER